MKGKKCRHLKPLMLANSGVSPNRSENPPTATARQDAMKHFDVVTSNAPPEPRVCAAVNCSTHANRDVTSCIAECPTVVVNGDAIAVCRTSLIRTQLIRTCCEVLSENSNSCRYTLRNSSMHQEDVLLSPPSPTRTREKEVRCTGKQAPSTRSSFWATGWFTAAAGSGIRIKM